MLALCLGCLHAGGRWFRAVPILIVLWVNLDSWFVLGPLLVVLFWAGRRLDYSRAALDPWPAWLVPASLLACLFSPHHVFGLTLPLELSPAVWRSGFALDPRYANVFLSPWNWSAFGEAVRLQFGVVGVRDLDRTRFSFLRVELDGSPILALSGLDRVRGPGLLAGAVGSLLCRCGRTDHRAQSWRTCSGTCFPAAGAGSAIAASLALVALAWLGWTVGFHNRERGAGWAIHTDATLARAATGIAERREKSGIPPDLHVFTTHVDLGHYLAWFAPNEKSTLDSRLQLFGYDDYGSLSHELGLLPADEHLAKRSSRSWTRSRSRPWRSTIPTRVVWDRPLAPSFTKRSLPQRSLASMVAAY